MFTFVPYNGGNLPHKDFIISQYFKNESVTSLDILILIRRPILTDLEKAIFQKVPAETS